MLITDIHKLRKLVGKPKYDKITEIELDLEEDVIVRKLPDRLPANLVTLISETTFLTSLPTLPDSLRILRVPFNCIRILPSEFPSSLEVLDIACNEVRFLPEITSNLRRLDVSSNKLESVIIPDGVEEVNISCNRLRYPPSIPSSVVRLYWWGNPFGNITPQGFDNIEGCCVKH